MDSGDVAELVVFLCCMGALVLYHVWYFSRGHWGNTSCLMGSRYVDLWTTSLKTRGLWAVAMMQDAKEGINSVQTWRNMIVASTLLVTAQSQIVGRLIQIITTQTQLQQVGTYSRLDPISGHNPLIQPEIKMALALGALFLSLLTFAQCARLAVHLGYLVRVVPAHPRTSLPLQEETIAMTHRASLYFTLGLRFFFAFIPLIMWLLGTLALLISTVILILALFFLDQIPVGHAFEKYAKKLQEEHEKGGDVEAPPPMLEADARGQMQGVRMQLSNNNGVAVRCSGCAQPVAT